MKKLFVFYIMLVHILVLSFSQTSGSWAVNNIVTWIEAVNGIRSGGNNKNYTITVTGNISVPSSNESTFGSVTGISVSLEGSATVSPASNGALLYIGNGQTIIIKDLALRGRSSNNSSLVRVERGGTFQMEGNASLSDNVGAGVSVDNGIFTMQGNSSVSNNAGAGVSVNSGTFTMRGNSSVSRNTRAGVSVDNGTFTMQDSASVSWNSNFPDSRLFNGGGVYVNGGNFTMQGSSSVSYNSASSGGVGGVCITGRGIFAMKDSSTVSGNLTTDSLGHAGGVCIYRGTFTMQDNSSVLGNATQSVAGGVYVGDGTFTMQGNSSVSSNETQSIGGGVYVVYGATFRMQDNSSVTGNAAIGDGGGVYASSNGGSNFILQSGTISRNFSGSGGGGVYIGSRDDVIFTMQGGTISGNITFGNGGGVYTGGIFNKTGGIIYGDDADPSSLNNSSVQGCTVYDNKNNNWRNSTASITMNSGAYGFWMNEERTVIPSLPSLVGVWEGSYFAGQGETGLLLTVWEENGRYRATFKFYNLPGRTNALEGSYYMNVTINNSTRKYNLVGYEWIVHPGNYVFVNLEGFVYGDIFFGSGIGGGGLTFRVVRR
jgi:hypothetical protein